MHALWLYLKLGSDIVRYVQALSRSVSSQGAFPRCPNPTGHQSRAQSHPAVQRGAATSRLWRIWALLLQCLQVYITCSFIEVILNMVSAVRHGISVLPCPLAHKSTGNHMPTTLMRGDLRPASERMRGVMTPHILIDVRMTVSWAVDCRDSR